jgi:hypothetical protein
VKIVFSFDEESPSHIGTPCDGVDDAHIVGRRRRTPTMKAAAIASHPKSSTTTPSFPSQLEPLTG